MKVLLRTKDDRINCENFFMCCTYKEFLSFAQDIVKNNILQRSRVKSAKTVYSLLLEDLKKGCVMPALVFALRDCDVKKIDFDSFNSFLQCTKKLLILDGLQRTFTLIDVFNSYNVDLQNRNNSAERDEFLNRVLRFELLINPSRFGILYRMLTLNTGQNPMSLRHQLEMLYSDKADVHIKEIKLVKDTEGRAMTKNYQFPFSTVIDGFDSYLKRREFPLDKQDLLDGVKALEKVSTENNDLEPFENFTIAYVSLIKKLREITNDKVLILDEVKNDYQIEKLSLGDTVSDIFSCSQAWTGFGAAVGKLKDLNKLHSFQEIISVIVNIKNGETDWLEKFMKNMDDIQKNANKIGNSQRTYFKFFFRELLNKDNEDSYLDVLAAVDNGYNNYWSQVE